MLGQLEETITNEKGEEIVLKKPYRIDIEGFCNGYAIVYLNDKAGFINDKGEEICPVKYDMLWPFRDNEYPTMVRLNGKYGLIDRNGKELCPIKYDRLDRFEDGLAFAECGKEMFYLTKYGKEEKIIVI